MGFIFDVDDFHFRAYGKMGDVLPLAFLGCWQQIKKIGPQRNILHSISLNHKTNKNEGHYPCGQKYVTNY